MSAAKLTLSLTRLAGSLRTVTTAAAETKDSLATPPFAGKTGKGGESEASSKGGGDKDDLFFVTDGGIKNAPSAPTGVSPMLNLAFAARVVSKAAEDVEGRIREAGDRVADNIGRQADSLDRFQRAFTDRQREILDMIQSRTVGWMNGVGSLDRFFRAVDEEREALAEGNVRAVNYWMEVQRNVIENINRWLLQAGMQPLNLEEFKSVRPSGSRPGSPPRSSRRGGGSVSTSSMKGGVSISSGRSTGVLP